MILGLLFDLDGTLADTAPDLAHVVNILRNQYGRQPVPLELLRPHASQGARGLLEAGFGVHPGDPFFDELREEFLELYQTHLCVNTRLFDGIPELLDDVDQQGIPWGIVTNKFTRFTDPLVCKLGLQQRAQCVVSGDTFARPKPYPDPLLGAARQLGLQPDTMIYLGDDERDMRAAQAAGMSGVIARYGYLGSIPPDRWNALGVIDHPSQLKTFYQNDTKARS